ncbi:hypothetical protein E1295_29440 [Nonomuraea mesophila]|uniref:Uncharacterized protein n=1 Tax=Nonomuraea mesophila TaxID=2530382 RepID=A0A4R5F2H7_9ACTN|nr:hypothetical protein E1295_29440 [Nonomuraea mesophila]
MRVTSPSTRPARRAPRTPRARGARRRPRVRPRRPAGRTSARRRGTGGCARSGRPWVLAPFVPVAAPRGRLRRPAGRPGRFCV